MYAVFVIGIGIVLVSIGWALSIIFKVRNSKYIIFLCVLLSCSEKKIFKKSNVVIVWQDTISVFDGNTDYTKVHSHHDGSGHTDAISMIFYDTIRLHPIVNPYYNSYPHELRAEGYREDPSYRDSFIYWKDQAGIYADLIIRNIKRLPPKQYIFHTIIHDTIYKYKTKSIVRTWKCDGTKYDSIKTLNK